MTQHIPKNFPRPSGDSSPSWATLPPRDPNDDDDDNDDEDTEPDDERQSPVVREPDEDE
jgi:hypothetical protein